VAASERQGNAVFLRLPRPGNHHDLGLFGLGTDAAPKPRGAVGLYHLAWQADTIDELAQARDTSCAWAPTPGSPATGHQERLRRRPDRNVFEVLLMLPREHWGAYESAAPVEPLDLNAELRRWSGVATAGRLVSGPVGSPP
jgi:hypothetical protein